jgi:hypothetical protein
MLHPAKLVTALEAKKDRFSEAEMVVQQDLSILKKALTEFGGLSLEEIESRLKHFQSPGALPTVEHSKRKKQIIQFTERWNNHRQAREWALDVLEGLPTFAVDGSQIMPSKDISIPVGVVQVGWFENRHHTDANYEKDIEVDILAPDELREEYSSAITDWQISVRRFEMETGRLAEYMGANSETEPKPVCFFDGSLIVSFIAIMPPERQRFYTNAIVRLIETSKQTRIPLVGYIDTSYASDFITMLTHILGIQLSGRVSDAGLFRDRMSWGDRSQVYICARDDDVLEKYYDQVCFVYLKTTGDNPPARLDIPRWMFEEGIHERVFDIVRAECVVGVGYPYVLETADAVSVLTMEDRERFYRLFQEFAEEQNLALRFSKKAVSKRGRRV